MIDQETLGAAIGYVNQHGGGGGGTSNYNDLNNKPQINGTTLSGNKSLSDLGIMPQTGVVANPSDEATTELEKIKVGNAVYSIPEGGSSLTAGDYIEIDENNKINVKMEKGDTTEYEYRFTGAYSPVNQLTIEKYWSGVLISTESYVNTSAYTPIAIDGLFEIWYSAGNPRYYWCYKLLEDSQEHSAGYEDSWYYTDTTTRTETFDVEDDSLTLVRKGDLNYTDLPNKPSINGVTLSGNKTTSDLGINIPTNLADLNGDSTHRTVTDTEKATWNGKSDFSGNYSDLNGLPTLGTASAKDVPASGDASSSQVVMGNDSRLADSRPASDVSSWAKQATKPTYTASEVGAIPSTDKGSNGGVAELDNNGKVPSSQLPSYVDDVLSYASQSVFPATGETGKIYIAEDTNKTYRWSGSAYAEISASLALGETSSTAYRGDRGKVAYDHSQTTGNPHGTTKSDVGLSNVPNVSTNDQTPTFTEASTRNNIVSGEKLSVIFGKIQKFFNDLKTVAFTGSFSDLSNKPENANTFQGTIAEWNQLTTAEKKAYDHASIPDSLDGNVTFPASKVMMLDGDSVEDRIGDILFVEKNISSKSIRTEWGSLFTASESVDISGLGLSNAPDVVSVTFGTTDVLLALSTVTSINKNNITVTLLRAASGIVSGKIMIMLKSNG